MGSEAVAALITAGGTLTMGLITAVTSMIRGMTRLRSENATQHKVNESKLDSLGEASERIETRLNDHIDWHMEQKNDHND